MTAVSKDIRDAFFDEACHRLSADPRSLVITNDMDVFALQKFRAEHPDRFINIGVAEQNMMNVAAGAAAMGRRVLIYGITSFVAFRCFEQTKLNICTMNLPVIIAGIGSGFAFGFDGPSHHGTQDLAAMRLLPELTIFNPGDTGAAEASARLAFESPGPVYVRIDKGAFPDYGYDAQDVDNGFKALLPPKELTIVSTGNMTPVAMALSERLAEVGITAGVIDVFRMSPFPRSLINSLRGVKAVVTLEENSLSGGLGTMMAELILDEGAPCRLLRLATLDEQFHEYGNRDWFWRRNNIDPDTIVRRITEWWRTKVGQFS